MKNILAAGLACIVVALSVVGCGSSGGSVSTGHPNCDAALSAIKACCAKPPASIAAQCPAITAAVNQEITALSAAPAGTDCTKSTFTCPTM